MEKKKKCMIIYSYLQLQKSLLDLSRNRHRYLNTILCRHLNVENETLIESYQCELNVWQVASQKVMKYNVTSCQGSVHSQQILKAGRRLWPLALGANILSLTGSACVELVRN